jgi:two-component system heavy metal sensor histidine kinase CusS
MRSIRTRLLLGIAVATVAAFALAGWITFVLFRSELLHEYDDLLGAKARTLAMLAEPRRSGVVFEFEEHGLVDFTRAFEPEFYEAWDDHGKTLANSGHARGAFPKLAPGTLDAPRYRFVTLPDGRPGRMIAVRFVPIPEDLSENEHRRPSITAPRRDETPAADATNGVTLIVARDTIEMDAALRRVAWTLPGVFTLTVAVVLALLSWIVTRGLKPLNAIARQIGDVNEFDLGVRLPSDGAPTEMRPVIDGFNGLLERLEGAFDRERTFSSNVAHELRTPLAGLLATIQVALSRQRSDVAYRTALQDCEAISQDTHRLIETLLLLTKIESGQIYPSEGTLVVDALVDEQWEDFAARANQKGLTVAINGPPGVSIAADRDQMGIVLTNLFDNAVEYSQPGGSIEIRWNASATGLQLSVANGGCDLLAEQTPHVFERFWRGDASRSATGTHAGLGLALSKRIVEALGGKIAASLEGRRFVVTIAFDAALVHRNGVAAR